MGKIICLDVPLKRGNRRATANFEREFIPHWSCCITEALTASDGGNCRLCEQVFILRPETVTQSRRIGNYVALHGVWLYMEWQWVGSTVLVFCFWLHCAQTTSYLACVLFVLLRFLIFCNDFLSGLLSENLLDRSTLDFQAWWNCDCRWSVSDWFFYASRDVSMATKGRGHGSHIPNVPGKSCRRKLSIAYFDFGATFGLLWLYNIVILNGFLCVY